jgi:hypothetical protein
MESFHRSVKTSLAAATAAAIIAVTLLSRSGPASSSTQYPNDQLDDLFLYEAYTGNASVPGEVKLADGDGTWTQGSEYSTFGGGWQWIIPGRFNSDEFDDLFLYDPHSGVTAILFASGSGDWINGPEASIGKFWNPALGDFNGDGLTDVFLAEGEAGNEGRTLLNEGNGVLTFAEETTTLPNLPWYGSPANLNADSFTDIVLITNTAIIGATSLGNGEWLLSQATLGDNPGFIAIGNFNADAYSDVFLMGLHTTQYQIVLADGDGTWTVLPESPAIGEWNTASYGDFDGDGLTDIFTFNVDDGGTEARVFFANGSGAFSPGPINPTFATGWHYSAGNFDDDGLTDLALTRYAETPPAASVVLFADGAGDWVASEVADFCCRYNYVVVGKFAGTSEATPPPTASPAPTSTSPGVTPTASDTPESPTSTTEPSATVIPTPTSTGTSISTSTNSATATPGDSGGPTHTIAADLRKGDIDCDGHTRMNDLTAMLLALAGLGLEVPEGCETDLDLNCSGGGDAIDSLVLLQHLAAVTPNLPNDCAAFGTPV